MKKGMKTIMICFIGLGMGIFCALPARTGQGQLGFQPPVRIKRPDVKAGLSVQVEKTETNPEEVCYRIRPVFLAQNIGTGTAQGFRVGLQWWASPPKEGSSWLSPKISLHPHQTRTWGPGATWNINCCLSKERKEHKTILIVITADANNNVWEGNEGNNVVKKKIELHWTGHFTIQTAP